MMVDGVDTLERVREEMRIESLLREDAEAMIAGSNLIIALVDGLHYAGDDVFLRAALEQQVGVQGRLLRLGLETRAFLELWLNVVRERRQVAYDERESVRDGG